jgi:hypothetical protein
MKTGEQIDPSAPPRVRREEKRIARRARRAQERRELRERRMDEPVIDPRHTGGWTD